jgi:hypothetical protein
MSHVIMQSSAKKAYHIIQNFQLFCIFSFFLLNTKKTGTSHAFVQVARDRKGLNKAAEVE